MTRLPDGHAERHGGGLQPPLTRPPDFESFWEKTRAALAGIPPSVSREPLESQSAALGFKRLAFDSLGEARVSGYAILW
ncbi:MAG: hypothetical protein H0U55_17580 [Rubrobacteraceae bacterium]|nr:hypothetical protein [Rubrobacteraceae bacterium]